MWPIVEDPLFGADPPPGSGLWRRDPGGAYLWDMVHTADIDDGAITAAKLAPGVLGGGSVPDGSITSLQILDGTIQNVDISPTAAIAKAKLAPLAIVDADVVGPISASKISGGGPSGAVVSLATTVAGLGAGTDGQLARLRLQPTTQINVASIVLPAATLTVGNTHGFPTGGTVTIVGHGTVTYTGKTATTLTGCSGGSGTTVQGDVVTLASVNAGTADFEFVDLVFTAALGKWLSRPQNRSSDLQLGSGAAVANAWSVATPTNNIRLVAARWRWYEAAGLRPQLKASGQLFNGAFTHTNVQVRMHFYSSDYGIAMTSATDAGSADPLTASPIVPSVGNNTDNATETGWADWPAAVPVKDVLLAGLDTFCTATTGGSEGLHGDVLVRWVG